MFHSLIVHAYESRLRLALCLHWSQFVCRLAWISAPGLVFVSAMLACSGSTPIQADAGGDSVAPAAGTASGEAPRAEAPVTDYAPQSTSARTCLISADCGAGSHCDLYECVSGCNARKPCESGQVCSARGRCLLPARLDADPEPTSQKRGQLVVQPTDAALTDRDERLLVTLATDSPDPVSYRVVLSAPHLSLPEARGEFVSETVLAFDVDADGLERGEIPGTVRIITDLGEAVVHAPLRVGLTGRYEGALSYSVGDLPLGDAQLVLDLEETLGDVSARVDAERSLLFPEQNGEATYGRGSYTLSEGLELTLSQTLPAAAAGERNHFAREVGRELRLHLQPSEQGTLEGSFEERIFGVFEQPMVVHGSVYLRPRPLRETLAIAAPNPRVMPTVVPGLMSTTAFDERVTVPSLEAATAAFPGCLEGAGRQSCLEQASRFYFGGLGNLLTGISESSDPLGDLSSVCEEELYSDVTAWIALSGRGGSCANAGGLLAILRELALAHSPASPDAASLFHRTVAYLLAPHLLMAQDGLVRGVRESFLGGPGGQLELYRSARSLLAAPARLIMQPRVLEFLRRTQPRDAAASSDPSLSPYPALRALSRLLYVLSSLEGELASLAAAEPASDRSVLARETQEHAILTVIEAGVVSTLLDGWDAVPPGVGAELLGALTPLDRGFRTLLDGQVLFGVPEGEIPLAFDPARAQPTNFEQLLLLRAAPALAQQAATQAAFLGSTRDFEQAEDALSVELEQVRAGYEATIASICGPSFDVSLVTREADWEACGAVSGALAEALLQIQLRQAEVASAFGRLEGIQERVRIEHQALFDAGVVRDRTLLFLSSSGSERAAMAEMENILNAAQIALELASNASLWNLGLPAAMGAVAGVLETTKGTLHVRREELAMLQSMTLADEARELEVIQSGVRVKSLLVDAAQIELDMEQLDIQLLESLMAATDLLDTAKRSALERTRLLARIEESPAADPIYRTLMHDTLLQALLARREAQRWLYRAGRALEYETNTPLGDGLGRAVLAAHNQSAIAKLSDCLLGIHGEYALEYGIAQEFKTTLSVRTQLGVTGARKDEVTGDELSPGELFRRVLLENQNLDGEGGVAVRFTTNLEPDNGLWSSAVCNDKLTRVRAKLVGDFLGDDEAEVHLTVAGGGMLRACSGDQILAWNIDTPDRAIVQAGVNSFGSAAPNTTLHGQAVARPSWELFIPGARHAPANADLNLERLDDVVLELTHEALPFAPSSSAVSLACLSTIGVGG